MPKIDKPFVPEQPGTGVDNYIDGGPTRAGLEELRSKANSAPVTWATVAEAESAEYSEPETVAVTETAQFYVYDNSSALTRDGIWVLNTGGTGRLVSILLLYVLSSGRAGGQTLNGGTGAGDDLTITSTSNATNGSVKIGTMAEFDEALGTYGLGAIPTSDTKSLIKGLGNTSATYAAKIQNSDGTDIATFRDDTLVELLNSLVINGGNPTLDFKPSTASFNVADRLGFNRENTAMMLYQDTALAWVDTDSVAFDKNPDTEIKRLSAGVIGTDALIVSGQSNTSATYAAKIQNSDSVDIATFRDDGLVTIPDTLQVATQKNTGANFKKPTDVTTATYSILTTDNFVGVSYTTTGAVVVELPSLAEAWDATTGTGQVITIKDTGGNAGANNITINRKAATSDTIDGATSASITANYNSLQFIAISSIQWAIF